MLSNCCGSNIISPDSEGNGRCGECKEMCSPEAESWQEEFENEFLTVRFTGDFEQQAKKAIEHFTKFIENLLKQEKIKAIDEKIEILENFKNEKATDKYIERLQAQKDKLA